MTDPYGLLIVGGGPANRPESAMELVSVVVVPARDEEHTIATCLEALAAQTVPAGAFETVLVADACTDRTESVAREAARELGLALTVLRGPGGGSGPARRIGMDAAADRLVSLGLSRGLIATTDADSAPSPDWLARQLAHLNNGADVIAGLIELADEDVADLPDAVLDQRRLDAERRMIEVIAADPEAGHHHFAGASLGVTAELYRRVGGLDPAPALEDEAFGKLLRDRGIPILRAADVRVRTAGRTTGRARRGLSVDLAVSTWRERRRYRAEDFSAGELAKRKRATTVTVIVPAKECASTIGAVIESTVGPLRASGLLDEVVVIDAGSRDGTAERAAAAGAQVLQQDELLPAFGRALGKGDAMWRAVHATDGEIVCFLDADTEDPHPDHLLGLLGPLLTDSELILVKGAFDRPFKANGQHLEHEGGRVTELLARPVLNLHFPLLAGFAQPLAGEFAARRDLLERVPFPVGYGIEIALLIDALRKYGLDALAESQLGSRQNRHQPLRTLSEMAFAVLAAAEQRIDGARSATGGHYLRPWEDSAIVRVPVSERAPLRSLEDGVGALRIAV
jgi:glucosyl-3-phosphoglycerate synthase